MSITPAMPHSLYFSEVMHHRLTPKRHRFVHRLFFFYMDLDELTELETRLNRWIPQIFQRCGLRLLGVERAGLYSFYRDDHLPALQKAFTSGHNSTIHLKGRLLAWLCDQGHEAVAQACDRVRLVTQLRVLGYVFNPVSFYFCLASDGSVLGAVAEVQNTFGELKPYWIPPDSVGEGDEKTRLYTRVPKLFYVSPFSALTDWFEFRLSLPDDRLNLVVNDQAANTGEPLMLSRMTGQRQPLTAGVLLKATMRYPWVTLQIIVLIHWHALRLWMKRIPFFTKEAHPEWQQALFRHHSKPVEGFPL